MNIDIEKLVKICKEHNRVLPVIVLCSDRAHDWVGCVAYSYRRVFLPIGYLFHIEKSFFPAASTGLYNNSKILFPVRIPWYCICIPPYRRVANRFVRKQT